MSAGLALLLAACGGSRPQVVSSSAQSPAGIELIGVSFAETPTGHSPQSISIAVPDGVHPGDLLVASVLGLYTQPNHPIEPPQGWEKIDQVVHMGSYWRVATDGEPKSYAWSFGLRPIQQWSGFILAYRGAKSLAAAAGWPSCQLASDAVCRGMAQNVPNPECESGGCQALTLPKPQAPVDSGLLIGIWWAHLTAGSLTPPTGLETIMSRQSGLVVVTAAQGPWEDARNETIQATPARPNWVRGISQLLILH